MTVIIAPNRNEPLVSSAGQSSLRFSDVLENLATAVTALTNGVETVEANEDAYTPTNVTTDREFDADTVTVAELADIVGTLIADLKKLGIVP